MTESIPNPNGRSPDSLAAALKSAEAGTLPFGRDEKGPDSGYLSGSTLIKEPKFDSPDPLDRSESCSDTDPDGYSRQMVSQTGTGVGVLPEHDPSSDAELDDDEA